VDAHRPVLYRITILAYSSGSNQQQVTAYGAKRQLHSGHYGNWAPNPALMLAQLVASMKDATATAAIDLRPVKGVTNKGQVARVIEHIRKQGYFVVATEPDDKTRLAHPRIAKVVVSAGGYNAARTPMDLPAAQNVIATVSTVRRPVFLKPTSGGSSPREMITDVLIHSAFNPISLTTRPHFSVSSRILAASCSGLLASG
jgi:hypothetical protein